jgi:RNA polymerase sigma-70 factor (ECF subfamily)
VSDKELMVRAKSGDRSAFKEIVDKYYRRVINVAYRLLEDREEAEDVAQETFLRVYRSFTSYEPKAEVTTYLYTIATRLALNRLRKKKRFRWFSLDEFRDEEGKGSGEIAGDPGDRPDRLCERAERETIVRLSLDALPPAQKTAVILSRFEGLSYKQIAKVMNISVSAVESKLHRAKQTLRKQLSPYYEL